MMSRSSLENGIKYFLTLFAQVSTRGRVVRNSEYKIQVNERNKKKCKEKKITAIDNIQMDTLIREGNVL